MERHWQRARCFGRRWKGQLVEGEPEGRLGVRQRGWRITCKQLKDGI